MATSRTRTRQARVLSEQQQLFHVAGHLSVPVNGSTSWTFVVYGDNGDQAVTRARAIATSYQLGFVMELVQYVRGPRPKRGRAGYNRTTTH